MSKKTEKEEAETETQREMEEAEKRQQLIKRAYRWPKYVAAQRFISRLILTAHCTTSPVAIIDNICRAAMETESFLALTGEKVEGVDFQLLKDIYNFSMCLNAPQEIKFDCVWSGQGWICKKLYRVHWNFETRGEKGKTNYERLASPWFRGVECWSQFLKLSKEQYLVVRCQKCSFPFLNEPSQGLEEKLKEVDVHAVEDQAEDAVENQTIFNFLLKTYGVKGTKTKQVKIGGPILYSWKAVDVVVDCVLCPNCKQKLNVEDLTVSAKENVCWSRPWIVFYDEAWNLTEGGLAQLRTQFHVWAVQICSDVAVKLCQIIDPDIYREVERLMGTEKRGEEAKEE